MDKRLQSNYSTSLTTNNGETHTNLYYLQVKPDGSTDTEAIPLQLLVNGQDPDSERYLISVIEGKQLHLLIDPHDQHGHTQTDYRIPTPELHANLESSNSVQILSNIRVYPNTQTEQNQTVQRVPIHTETVQANADCIQILESSLQKSVCSGNSLKRKENVTKQLDTNTRKVLTQKFVHISDRIAPPRAVAVLPAALQIRRDTVSPRRPLPARVRFGPVEGISRKLSSAEVESLVLDAANSQSPLFLLKAEDGVTHIDGSDKDKSNWLSLLPLGTQDAANLWLLQEEDSLYAVTTRPVAARRPLILGYSKQYADTYRITGPASDVEAELSHQCKWWCHECQRVLPSPTLLQRHMDLHHVEEKQRAKQRYRCKHCTRTFCRRFTLRRHLARHCTNKDNGRQPNKSTEATGLPTCLRPEELPDLSLNTSNTEDSRLPSDESLQTLTNNLDFSTNLFDTDRIPNLDISGSSRSDTEFNPYSLSLKEDIGLTNSIDFPIETENCNYNKEDLSNTHATTNNPASSETVYLNCRHCGQSIVKGKQRQHTRVCPGRKFQCDCGRTFPYKDKLALHIHLDHANKPIAKEKQAPQEPESQQYRCETCKLNFKRRGMLVNHLWRAHDQLACSVPLERRELMFPCAACPKIYATAAKRARHVTTHHPGCELTSAPALVRGWRACEPAACPACPRQYATRAKLLQHVRANHPHLAPSVKKMICIKKEIK